MVAVNVFIVTAQMKYYVKLSGAALGPGTQYSESVQANHGNLSF